MRLEKCKLGLAAALLIALAGAASAQTAAAPAIDPEAVAALDRMGAYLRTVKTFRVTARTTRDRVLVDGLLVQRDGKADILAQFPSHLRIDTINGDKQRLYLYDGKNFTLYGQAIQYYATVPAPATIGQLAGVLADKYDISFPWKTSSGGAPKGSTRARSSPRRTPDRATCWARPASTMRFARKVSTGRSGSRGATTRSRASS